MNTDLDFDFDATFTVHEDLTVSESLYYAPSVFHGGDSDVIVDSPEWEPLTGWTGQYNYGGAVMHASETFEGGIRDHVLSTPGTYVLTVVNVLPDDDDEDPEPAGWAVLRHL